VFLTHETSIRSFSPGCFLRQLTGYYCGGCGGTRAFFAFLKGDFGGSWRMNPLFLIGLALAGVFGGLAILDRLPAGRPQSLASFQLTARAGWWTVGALLGFSILRNLPSWPFTLLAPH
jgi:hypothetical protein